MNRNKLKGKLRERGLTQQDAARRMGLSLSCFNAKLNGRGGAEYYLRQIRALIDLLELTPQEVDEIFFT